MAFCYFSLWAPGRMAKLQSDISMMISPGALPPLRACRSSASSASGSTIRMYHLDGVGAIRHLDALLEIEELDAVQWTPGVGQPQGGDPCWYDLYRRIRAGRQVDHALLGGGRRARSPCSTPSGPDGVNVLMHFTSERDIDARPRDRGALPMTQPTTGHRLTGPP